MAVMGKLDQSSIFTLIQVLAQKFVGVAAEGQYNWGLRSEVLHFFSKSLEVLFNDLGMIFQISHYVPRIHLDVGFYDVGHVGTVIARIFKGESNLEIIRSWVGIMEINKWFRTFGNWSGKIQSDHDYVVL